MVRKSIFCFIICIALFFSLGNLLASNEESQNQVISQSKVVKYYKTIEESESQEKSSQVIITNIIFAQVLYINESQTIEVWSQNISDKTMKLFHRLYVRYPDGNVSSFEGTHLEIDPGLSLWTRFPVSNVGKGIGIFDFSCEVWEDKTFSGDEKHDEKHDSYYIKFYMPSGVSANYYCDDTWHHPSDTYILTNALYEAGGSTSPREAVNKLMKFVYYNVTFDPNDRYRTPDMIVLRDKTGDCNDFADLYVGLARSLNIPTRIVTGNAFKTSSGGETDLYGIYCRPVKRAWGHAWAESYYNGAFHHVDPTNNVMESPLFYIVSDQDIHSMHASAYTGCDDNYLENSYWIQDGECCLNGFIDVTTVTDGGYDTSYYCPSDQDNDGVCDNFDVDKDNDAIPNSEDLYPCIKNGRGFGDIPSIFLLNNFHVVGDTAKCTDVLGTANVSWGVGSMNMARPEGKTDLMLTQSEHDYYNLIVMGGPAVNPVATEFGTIFGITYSYVEGYTFDIFVEGKTMHLDLGQYPSQDICIVYLGWQNNRPVLIIWGYGWQGTYAGAVFMSYPQVWNAYTQEHLLLLRWTDTNANQFIEFSEIHPENVPEVPVTLPPPGTPQVVNPSFGNIPLLFGGFSFHVVGDTAKCTDVLGTANVSWAFGDVNIERPEGKTDLILTVNEHNNGNLIVMGGPAVNPVATEFGSIFGITYSYVEGVSFDISAEGKTIHLDLGQYPSQDICIVYLGQHNNRNILIIWGYGWQGTYAGSVFMSDIQNWSFYSNNHLLLLRWFDSNYDGYIQTNEIYVEGIK
ncbi:MAG: transglutaminase family protein [Candidatus Methanofastidiosia archaeon]